MMKRHLSRGVAILGVSALLLAGCSANSADDAAGGKTGKDTDSASSQEEVDPNAEVTIQVQGLAAGAEETAKKLLADRVADFESKNPNITVETLDWSWDPQTFASQLAGGTLPNVFNVPFTEGQTLIANEQVYNIDQFVKELPYGENFGETVGKAGQNREGEQWLIPHAAYGMSLTYNRELFEEAGLDPDAPPQTWEEVRSAAKKIADATGQAGYSQMAGGWILSAIDYSFGGRVQEQADDGTVTVNVDSDSMRKQLELLKAMRWEDNSMGANMLHDWGTINADFASGKIGMFVGGSDLYDALIQMNQMNPDIYGITVLPQEGDNAGVLGGGALGAVSADSTPEEAAAGVKWIDYYFVQPLASEEGAVAEAEQRKANNQPVGMPGFPIFDEEMYKQRQEWIKPYISVPMDQMKPYTDKMFEQNLIPEPPVNTQAFYEAIGPMQQAVLTDEKADIDALLKEYQGIAESTVS